MIEIRDFKVDAGDYQRVMWRLFFGRHWPWFALPVAACGGVAALQSDVRWLLAALMLLCLVFPMVLVLVYINYALTLEVRWSLMEKTAVFDNQGIHLTFTDQRMKPRTIGWGDIASATRDRRALYFHLRVRRFNFFVLPLDALARQGIHEDDVIDLAKQHLAE
ncbi:MAG: hypothetical protein IKR25_09625 [Muribaculaceae bacterium]|nr:hypothetical protein [Muribaculaceae bacterium]